MPICSRCKIDQSIERFAKQTGKHSRHRFYKICISCQTKQKKVWKDKLQYYRTTERYYFFSKKYGLTREAFDALYDQQDGKCAICLIDASEEQLPGRWGVLYVDHNHATNEVRGLLCLCCNSLLGFAKDSEDVLCAAINYLRKSRG